MHNWQEIIDGQHHPIDDINSYATLCRSELQKNSILVLNQFLTHETLLELQHEANALHEKAYYCSQSHNILLRAKNTLRDDNHPCNIEVVSDKGCVPHDMIPADSKLRAIYDSEIFKRFIKSILSIDNIYPYVDSLSSINYNYYEENQQLGWHFDNASFAITLMIQSSKSGGEFQYAVNARNMEQNTINVPLIDSVLQSKASVNELNSEEGSLVLFYGRNTLHRVTPVTSQEPRVLATLNYNLEKNFELSENARLTFFGRLR
jgi:hypothetical protein